MKTFEELSRLYSLSKTVEFSAIPEPKTAKLFQDFWDNILEQKIEGNTNFFSIDKDLSAATETIKTVLNAFHERFINFALSSNDIVNYDFSVYLEKYRKKENDSEEDTLRKELGKIIHSKAEAFINKYIKNLPEKKAEKFTKELNKQKKENKQCSIFSIMEMRELFQCNPSLCPKTITTDSYDFATKTLKGYWHALDTFIQNRENYYVYEKEQATSVITRIVYDNLPTFCANILLYEDRADTYNAMFAELQECEVEMKIKNPVTNVYEDITGVDLMIFEINRFGETLTQSKIERYNTEVAKLNEVVNLYNQQFVGTKHINKLKPFATLHKQIGCKPSIVPMDIRLEAFYEKDVENSIEGECKSLEALVQIIKNNVTTYTSDCEKFSVAAILRYLEDRIDYTGLYMTDQAIELYLRKYMVDAYAVKESIKSVRSCTIFDRKKPDGEQVKWNKAVELGPLFERLNSDYDFETVFKPTVYKEYSTILDSNKSIGANFVALLCSDIKKSLKEATNFTTIDGLRFEDKNNNATLFTWLDSVLALCRHIKSFNVLKNKIKGAELDTEMMQYVEHILEPDWFGWYAAIDIFVSRKPQDKVKDNQLKLNFNKSIFMNGWGETKIKDNKAFIVKKGGLFYLCILLDPKLVKAESRLYVDVCDDAFQMVVRPLKFRTITNAYKGLFGKNYKDEYDVQKKIKNVQNIIKDNYVIKYPKLRIITERSYSTTNDLKKEIDSILEEYSQCEMVPINWKYLKEQEGSGVFILKLYNKDYSQATQGSKNLFTLYWEDLFRKDSSHRINGGAKLFVRDAAGQECDTIVHKQGSYLINKRDRRGYSIPNDVYTELYNYINKKGKLVSQQAKDLLAQELVVYKEVKEGHEIIKDRRFYSGRKYTFHCPIKFNEGAEAFPKNPEILYSKFDQQINSALISPTFLGIDRGEKHLVYWCELKADGTIKDCGNFDTINGTNYVQLLEDRANLRKQEQKARRNRSGIKNLKESYVKLVTSEIAKKAILPAVQNAEAPMYIVLEKLNKEMKGKRAHIEKQIYQALETALANKLSLFVDKNISEGPASIKKPLQLVPPFKTFDDIDGKDSFGIMQYTRANYTSVTDPLTGWRQSIYIPGGKSDEIIQRIIVAFDDIKYDGKDYSFDYTDSNTKKRWTLYSGINGKPLDRFYGYVKGADEHHTRIDVVGILDSLFANFDKTKSLRDQLVSGVELKKNPDSSRTAAEELRFVIKIIQQIRNTGNESKDDNYLQSPVRDSEGRHFDTREAYLFSGLEKILDGDANGAYNIARKGYIMNMHRECWKNAGSPTYVPDKKKRKAVPALNLFVSDREWDLWLQDREEWQKQVESFAIKKEP